MIVAFIKLFRRSVEANVHLMRFQRETSVFKSSARSGQDFKLEYPKTPRVAHHCLDLHKEFSRPALMHLAFTLQS